MGTMSKAANDVLDERQRQELKEGWTDSHDDYHLRGQLAAAAACYTLVNVIRGFTVGLFWPWDMKAWKPKSKRENLVRAGALILAEIERLDRAAALTAKKEG